MMTIERLSATAEQTATAYALVLVVLAVTMGPAIILLRGKGADDAMMKVTIAVAATLIMTRLANVYLVMTISDWIPLGYLPNHGFSTDPLPSMKTLRNLAWVGMALYGHATIHAIPRLCRLWTTVQNRIAVSMFMACLFVTAMAPLPATRFWYAYHKWHIATATAILEQNRRATDSYTLRWLEADPNDPAGLVLRARFLQDTERSNEALALLQRAASLIPDHWETMRAAIDEEIAIAARKSRE